MLRTMVSWIKMREREMTSESLCIMLSGQNRLGSGREAENWTLPAIPALTFPASTKADLIGKDSISILREDSILVEAI